MRTIRKAHRIILSEIWGIFSEILWAISYTARNVKPDDLKALAIALLVVVLFYITISLL